jgi:hypothetical protein
MLQPLIQFVPNILQTVGKLGMFSYYLFSNDQFAILSLFGLLYLPFFFWYAEWSGKFWLKWQLPVQKAMIEMYSVLAEHLQNIPTIKAFNGYKVASQSLVAQVPTTFKHTCACDHYLPQINRSARLNLYTTFITKMAEVLLSLVTDANSTFMR